jgi:zinc protease
LAAELKRKLDVDATLIPGSGGVFDVTIDGKLVFSKKKVGRFPEEGEVLGLMLIVDNFSASVSNGPVPMRTGCTRPSSSRSPQGGMMVSRLFRPALALALAAAAALAAGPARAAAPVHQEVLSNGLTILLQEDHAKPLVGVCIFVKGGSRTETPALAGLSHYYEHLIFRGGSVKQGELQFRKEMQRIGQESGGYTTNDWTCYGFTTPTQNLDEALWRSVDAWMGLKLTQAKVDKERQVVMEEYNQGEDRPDYKVYYQIERLMFRDHPYKRDTIGLKEAILHSSLATFRTFYEERYVPNQFILAAVGDFDTKTMRDKVAKAFAPYRRGKDDFELGAVEKPQTEFRMGVETVKTPSTWTILGFHVPPHASPDTPALTVLERCSAAVPPRASIAR